MLKWLLLLFLALLLSGLLSHGLGRLPAAWRLPDRPDRYFLPLAASLVLSLLLGGVVVLF